MVHNRTTGRKPMSKFTAVTDEALANARRDPAFRQTLLTTHLDRLLAEMHKVERSTLKDDPVGTRQIREAAILAGKLADLIRIADRQRIAAGGSPGKL